MTERTRLISYLLYGLFSAEKKGTVMRSKPEEMVSLTMRQFLSSLRQDLARANLTTLIFTKQTDLCLQVFDP